MKKKMLLMSVGMSVFLGIFMFVQVWFEIFSEEIIWKVLLSCLIIFVVFFVVARLFEEIHYDDKEERQVRNNDPHVKVPNMQENQDNNVAQANGVNHVNKSINKKEK